MYTFFILEIQQQKDQKTASECWFFIYYLKYLKKTGVCSILIIFANDIFSPSSLRQDAGSSFSTLNFTQNFPERERERERDMILIFFIFLLDNIFFWQCLKHIFFGRTINYNICVWGDVKKYEFRLS